MGIVNTTTGHSPKEERKVAGIIYMAIALAVIVGIFTAFFMGGHRELDPQKSPNPETMTAPDALPGQANPAVDPSAAPNTVPGPITQ